MPGCCRAFLFDGQGELLPGLPNRVLNANRLRDGSGSPEAGHGRGLQAYSPIYCRTMITKPGAPKKETEQHLAEIVFLRMMQKKPPIDIINIVLEECIEAYPVSSFVISLYKQYQQRGSLSKKQLEGLYGKAQKIEGLAPGKLAGLENIIKRMPTRYKSEAPAPKPLYQKDEAAGEMIEAILAKYPQHKRVLYLKSKFGNNEPLTSADLADLKRFSQMLNK